MEYLPEIEINELRQLLRYDPGTGVLFWRERGTNLFTSASRCRAWNTKYAGAVAGYLRAHKDPVYRYIKIFGTAYFAHRLAFAIYYGEWPKDEIDHIDGDGTNNKIENLREVDRTTNNKNMRQSSRNKSGVNGVRWNKQWRKWHAYIYRGGKHVYLGSYKNIDDAILARHGAEKMIGGFTERHGSAA